ncbi:hypothetical protein AMATHDRAFT_134231 [Amanita thiersii Skay4041]|uniref:Cytochrome P450 n=1 Tax=Amanita thiersii Skay4041 TaxID=703135 RepID=A0A2A9NWY5_9AGAR|nr:hypothetical protein AMATHDRAFT_134231 [Amanita thiersii Skay4041]
MVFIQPMTDPLRHLPGPDGAAYENHFRQLMDPKYSLDTHEDWATKYGKTFRFHGFGKYDYRLISLDFRVITHVLHSPIYEKPWQTRSFLARLIGKGIFSMEGNEHRRQRRLIGPAFSSQSAKQMLPIFVQKAEELREKWLSLISNASDSSLPEQSEGASIDIAHWISRASFDVIGLAGFDYHFRALQDETEDVYLAYRRMFSIADKGPGIRGILELYMPWLRVIWPTKDVRVTNQSLRTIKQAGKILISRKKNEVLQNHKQCCELDRKDLLSLLITANLSTDIPKRLSDTELHDQCSTMLLAGSDSVSLAISWCLYLLSLHPKIQTRLRDELRSNLCIPSGNGGNGSDATSEVPHENGDIMHLLPYLDSVVRETLRICPPVHGTIRVATTDDCIPISDKIVLRNGSIIQAGEHIRIRKGSYIHIPIEGLNCSPDIWGPTARLFDPDRWMSLPEEARSPLHPGLGNVMTFGFGPHSCLGYKFTLSEIKVFLSILIPSFEFIPAKDIQIGKFNAILTRPYVIDQWNLGTQLPLIVRPYEHPQA